MKKKLLINIILVIIAFLLYKLVSPIAITPENFEDKIALKLEKLYEDSFSYDSSCKENHILIIIYYYSEYEKYKKCKEWIVKRDKCIALQPKDKYLFLKDYSYLCEDKNE